MMGIGWQDVIVVVGVVAAIAYLVRRRRRAAHPKPTLVALGRSKRGATGSRPTQ